MTQFTKEQAVRRVFSCADEYKSNLVNRNLLFMYIKGHKISALEVTFRAYHFMHLTGLKTKSKIPAADFFKRCIKRRLSPNDIYFDDNGTTQMKLEVLPILMNKDLSANMICDYDGLKLRLKTDKLVGGKNGCVGFSLTETGEYIPKTLLSLDIRKDINSYHRIIATYRKNITDSIYTEIVHSAKDIDWDKITHPDK